MEDIFDGDDSLGRGIGVFISDAYFDGRGLAIYFEEFLIKPT
jgi:hypothetical protein